MSRIRVNGAYVIRSAESRPCRVNAAIAVAAARRVPRRDDRALVRAVKAKHAQRGSR